jgi:hypothetical protein
MIFNKSNAIFILIKTKLKRHTIQQMFVSPNLLPYMDIYLYNVLIVIWWQMHFYKNQYFFYIYVDNLFRFENLRCFSDPLSQSSTRKIDLQLVFKLLFMQIIFGRKKLQNELNSFWKNIEDCSFFLKKFLQSFLWFVVHHFSYNGFSKVLD